MSGKAGAMFSEALGGLAHQRGRTIPLKGGATGSRSQEPVAEGGGQGRSLNARDCTSQIKPALFRKFDVFQVAC